MLSSLIYINAVISSNVKEKRQAKMSGSLVNRKRTFHSKFICDSTKKLLDG